MEIKNYIHLLNKISLFNHYDEKSLLDYFETIDYRLTQYSKDRIIFFENEECLSFFIVLVGFVQV